MSNFKKLVNNHKDQVFNTCLGMVKNFEDAEDLAQEVFIEIYKTNSPFRGESSMKTWIYRIAINKSLQFIRWKKAEKRHGQAVDLEAATINLESDAFDHPGIKVENKELAKILFAAMEKLPENQQIAFTLHKVENLAQEEIGMIMNKSRASVESLIHRARQNLRKTLKTYYENQ